MDKGLYFPKIVSNISGCHSPTRGRASLPSPLNLSMTFWLLIWIEYNESDVTWLPRLSHKRLTSVSLSEYSHLQPSHPIRKPKLAQIKGPLGEAHTERNGGSQPKASINHQTHVWTNFLMIQPPGFESSRYEPRHCGAETSCPSYVLSELLMQESLSTINGCFTSLLMNASLCARHTVRPNNTKTSEFGAEKGLLWGHARRLVAYP